MVRRRGDSYTLHVALTRDPEKSSMHLYLVFCHRPNLLDIEDPSGNASRFKGPLRHRQTHRAQDLLKTWSQRL